MKKIVTSCLLLFCALASARYVFVKTGAAPAFSPASLTSLQIWLDGNDVLNGSNPTHNTKFGTWSDKSGHSNDFVQATSGNQFTYGSAQVNSKDVVVADGSANTYMKNASTFLSTGTAFTLFLTVEVTSALGTKFLGNLLNGNGIGGGVLAISGSDFSLIMQTGWVGSSWTTTNASNTIYMYEIGYNGSGATTGTNYLARKNGTTLTRAGANGGAGSNAFTGVGSDIIDPGSAMSGYILDLVFQSASATGTEEANMLTYEKAKWGF